MGSNAPADMSDAEFDALFAPATPAAQAAVGVSPADMSDQAFDQMFDPKAAAKPESNPNPAMGWLGYYGAKWKSGEASVMRGVMGEKALRGEVTYDQIKHDASLQSLQQLQKEAGNFESRVSQWDLRRWAGTAVESLPFMAEVTKGGAVGAAGGAAAGAGGAAILGQVGPQIGIPEEIVTVPVAAGFGARWGFRGGAFYTSAKLMSGQTYLDFLDAGLDPKVARPAAISSGIVMGVIEAAQIGQLGSVGRKAFVEQLKTEGGKAALRKFVTGYLKDVGEQVAEEELQQITELTAQSMAAAVSKNPDAMPTADEWKDQLVQTFIQSAQASAVLVGGSKAAGKVSGMATNVTLEGVASAIKTKEAIQEARQQALEIKQNIAGGALNARSALVQALETIRQGFEKAAPTEAQVTETQQMTPEQALEQVFAPLFDENGNLVQEARIEPDQLVAGIQQVVANVQELDASQQGPTDAQIAAAESQQTGGDLNGQGQAEGQIQGEGLLAPQPEIDPTRTLEVQGRTNQVMSEIQIIDNQINTLEKQMIARAADGKTTTQISGRIEKLYDQRDTLDEELVQLKYGMIQPEDTAGQDIKIKADKLIALRAKSVNETLKAYRKGLREGELITKADVKNVQNEVVALIRKSGMRLGDQAKFIQKLKNIQTRSQLTKALPEIQTRIDALLEADAKREATAQFERSLKQAKPKKTAKYPEGKFTADVQQTLDQYRTFAKDETAREAALQAYADALAGGKEAPVEVARAARIAQAVDFKNRTSAQIAQDAAELQDLMDSGRDAVMEKMLARKQADAERKAAAIESINGSKPYDETQRADSWRKEATTALRNFIAANETWRGLMHLISSDDKTHAMQDIADPSKAREEYFRRVDEAQAGVSRQFVAIAKSMKRQFGQSAQRKLAVKLAADERRAPVGEYTDAEGNTKPLVYSRAELRKLWMEFQAAKVDPVIKESFQQGNKFTFREDVADGQMSTEQLVEEVLAPEDIEMAQAQFQMYEDLYNRVLNPYWRERFGIDLPKAEMYSPIRREGYDVDDNKTLLENFMGEGGVKPSSAIKRTGSRLPIAAQSDISALTRHVEQITRFVAYDEFDRQTKTLFNDGDVRTLIQKKYGADVLSFIQQHRKEITTGQMAVNDKAWKMLDALRRQTATAYVGGKLASIPKQATAMVTALDEVGPVELARALVDIHAKPVETAKTLNQSATFRRLLMTGADRDLVEVLRNHRNNPITGREGLVGLMMAPVRIGVWYGAATSGLAVYRKGLAETGSPETALQRMNIFLTDTQQSGFIEDLSAAQRSGALGKIATMFGGDPYQAARQIVRAASDIVSDPTDTQAYLKALRTYAVFHLTVPVAFQLMVNAFDSDDEGEYDLEKLMRAAVFGPWGQIPILGDTINYASVRAYNALTGGDEFAFEPSTPVLSVFLNAAKFFEYAAKSWAEDDGEALLKAVHALAKASPALPKPVGGLPWPEIAKWFVPKPEKDEALIGE